MPDNPSTYRIAIFITAPNGMEIHQAINVPVYGSIWDVHPPATKLLADLLKRAAPSEQETP